MKIKIKQDEEILKKKKKVKKTVKKKSNGNTKRNIDLSAAYHSINISGRNSKKKTVGKIIRKFFILLFVVCLAFSSVYAYNHLMTYLCSLERFFIDNIEITGCKNIMESEIINLIPFKAGKSSFEVDLGRLEKELKDRKAELKDISIYRADWGKKIVVSLTERLPEVFIKIDDEKKGLDFDNKPFNLKGKMSDMKIPVIVFNNTEERKNLLKFYEGIKNSILYLVPELTEIKYGKVEDIVLTLNNETDIYWGQPKKNKDEEKAEKLQLVLQDLAKKKKKIKNVDLSFLDDNKDKIIVKVFVEEEK